MVQDLPVLDVDLGQNRPMPHGERDALRRSTGQDEVRNGGRLGPDRDLREAVVLVRPVERSPVCPGLQHEFDRLRETGPRVGRIDAIAGEVLGDAAGESGHETAARQNVDHRVFLRDPQRVQERERIPEDA